LLKGSTGWGANPGSFVLIYFLIPPLNRWATAANWHFFIQFISPTCTRRMSSVTILQFSSFAQPQSKCLLLFFIYIYGVNLYKLFLAVWQKIVIFLEKM
jgi:hypothetical protein